MLWLLHQKFGRFPYFIRWFHRGRYDSIPDINAGNGRKTIHNLKSHWLICLVITTLWCKKNGHQNGWISPVCFRDAYPTAARQWEKKHNKTERKICCCSCSLKFIEFQKKPMVSVPLSIARNKMAKSSQKCAVHKKGKFQETLSKTRDVMFIKWRTFNDNYFVGWFWFGMKKGRKTNNCCIEESGVNWKGVLPQKSVA